MDPLEWVCLSGDDNDINEEIDFAYLKAVNIPYDSDLVQTGVMADSKLL